MFRKKTGHSVGHEKKGKVWHFFYETGVTKKNRNVIYICLKVGTLFWFSSDGTNEFERQYRQMNRHDRIATTSSDHKD